MIVDVNVLLCYVDPDARFHDSAARWFDAALNSEGRIGLPWHSLLGFVRIATNPRVYPQPLTTAQAMTYVDSWLAAEPVWVPQLGPSHATVLRRLLEAAGTAGPLTPAAHLAALGVEHGVPVCSFDSDLARFPEVRWFRPE